MYTDTHLFVALAAAEYLSQKVDSYPHLLGGAGRPDWKRRGLTDHWSFESCVSRLLTKRQETIPDAVADGAPERADHEYGVLLHYLADAFDRSKSASSGFNAFIRDVQTALALWLAGHLFRHPLAPGKKGSTDGLKELVAAWQDHGRLPVYDSDGQARVEWRDAPDWASLDALLARKPARAALDQAEALGIRHVLTLFHACCQEVEPVLGVPVRYARELREHGSATYNGALCATHTMHCAPCPWKTECFATLGNVADPARRAKLATERLLLDLGCLVAFGSLEGALPASP